jgi:hypothetical protein
VRGISTGLSSVSILWTGYSTLAAHVDARTGVPGPFAYDSAQDFSALLRLIGCDMNISFPQNGMTARL